MEHPKVDIGAVRAPQQGRTEGRRGGRDRGEVWVVPPIFSSHWVRLRTPSFVPLAVPLCNAQGPLSEASSEPGGPCAHQVHSGLGLSSCLRLWVSALGHLPPGSVGSPIRQEMRRRRVRQELGLCITRLHASCCPRSSLAWGLHPQSQHGLQVTALGLQG